MGGRFWEKVQKTDGCWNWVAARTPYGYGVFTPPKGKRKYAHRLAYESIVGPIPPGLCLDHLCRNPSCVNPAHLEPVTQLENVRRGRRATQTACKHGHPYTDENTYRYSRGGDSRSRACRACVNAAGARYREKRRAAWASQEVSHG